MLVEYENYWKKDVKGRLILVWRMAYTVLAVGRKAVLINASEGRLILLQKVGEKTSLIDKSLCPQIKLSILFPHAA